MPREEENRGLSAPVGANRGGEARWDWVEPSVWNERMLTALDQGVKGGKWYSLMDKVCRRANLEAAFTKVKANQGAAGVDRVTVQDFERRRETNLRRLEDSLREGTYRPQAIRRAYIEKMGAKEKRPLGIPTVRDRVVQGALRHVLEPIFERDFAEHSYGFRPGRRCQDALRRVDTLLRRGYTWIVDADIQGCFDSIPRGPRFLSELKLLNQWFSVPSGQIQPQKNRPRNRVGTRMTRLQSSPR